MLTTEQRNALRQASQVMYDNGYPALASELDGILSASTAPAEGQEDEDEVIKRLFRASCDFVIKGRNLMSDDAVLLFVKSLSNATTPTTSEAVRQALEHAAELCDGRAMRAREDLGDSFDASWGDWFGRGIETGAAHCAAEIREELERIDRAAAKGESDE